MGQRRDSADPDEYLIAKALHIAIRVYDPYPEDVRPEGDAADMARILRERFPKYEQLLQGPEPDAFVV